MPNNGPRRSPFTVLSIEDEAAYWFEYYKEMYKKDREMSRSLLVALDADPKPVPVCLGSDVPLAPLEPCPHCGGDTGCTTHGCAE